MRLCNREALCLRSRIRGDIPHVSRVNVSILGRNDCGKCSSSFCVISSVRQEAAAAAQRNTRNTMSHWSVTDYVGRASATVNLTAFLLFTAQHNCFSLQKGNATRWCAICHKKLLPACILGQVSNWSFKSKNKTKDSRLNAKNMVKKKLLFLNWVSKISVQMTLRVIQFWTLLHLEDCKSNANPIQSGV